MELPMPKPFALIHTSPVLVPTFNTLCRDLLPGMPVFHMVDESLIKDTIAAGSLRKPTIRRLVAHIDSAAQAGAGAVLVTCSSIGEGVRVARALFDFPVFRIDEAMAERAVDSGRRIGVLATLQTTLVPTVRLLEETAAARGRRPEILSVLCEGAFDAVLAGDVETHDRIVGASLMELCGRADVIVLAQASMARVVASLPSEGRKVPILSSPELAMARVAEVITTTAGEEATRSGDQTGTAAPCAY
jgi:Asp/Glu/hydantoin racemase